MCQRLSLVLLHYKRLSSENSADQHHGFIQIEYSLSTILSNLLTPACKLKMSETATKRPKDQSTISE